MPPACRFTREQIVAAALAITRERGFDAVTARAIADTLHSSSKVIFSAFSGMDDLLAATIAAADAQYRAYSADFVRNSADPPYKAVGTAYIRFARNEPNLFHLLYMRDRRREDHSGDAENIAVLVDFLMAKLSLTREDATLLHIEMWAYVHGIAVLCASGQQNWDDALINPWFMVLLFVVAGMCARFALVQQGNRTFLRNRARKLLVPSTLGLFVLHWVTGYLNIRMGGAVDTIPKPLLYPISVLAGIGPLWFVQLLFLFSTILVLIRKIDRNDHLFRLGERTPSWLICAFALLIWGAAQVGNMPVITTYRIGIYLTAFLLGYAVFAHEAVMERVERMRWGTLAAAVIGAVAYGAWTNGQNYTDAAYLQSLWANVYLWAAVLAILGNARHYLNRETPVSRFFTRRSYALYVVHYPVLLLTAILLTERTTLPAALMYLLTLLIGFGVTLGLSEVIRHIPGIRYLVLGIRKEKKA